MSYKEIGENLGETINRSISGASIGAKGCYYICFGEAKTVGGETNRNIYSIGLGWGVVSLLELMWLERLNDEKNNYLFIFYILGCYIF